MAIENSRKSLGIEYCKLDTIQRVKDHFVLSCQIGQRYSDSSRFTKSNFDETGTIIKITQQKTGSKAVINIASNAIDKKIAFEILKKYDYCSPAAGLDVSNFNKYLHILCKSIGGEFNNDVTFENKINGSIVTETYKVWQLITSHTARRTFITYWASSNDMNIIKLQKCTGHKDVRQINRYTILEDD